MCFKHSDGFSRLIVWWPWSFCSFAVKVKLRGAQDKMTQKAEDQTVDPGGLGFGTDACDRFTFPVKV